MEEVFNFISPKSNLKSFQIKNLEVTDTGFKFITSRSDPKKPNVFKDIALIDFNLTKERHRLQAFKIKNKKVTTEKYVDLGQLFPKFLLHYTRLDYPEYDIERINSIFKFINRLDSNNGFYLALMFYSYEDNRRNFNDSRKGINFLELLDMIPLSDIKIFQALQNLPKLRFFSIPQLIITSDSMPKDLTQSNLFLGENLERMYNSAIKNIVINTLTLPSTFTYQKFLDKHYIGPQEDMTPALKEKLNQLLFKTVENSNYKGLEDLLENTEPDYNYVFQLVDKLLTEFHIPFSIKAFNFMLYLLKQKVNPKTLLLREILVSDDLESLKSIDLEQLWTWEGQADAIRTAMSWVEKYYKTRPYINMNKSYNRKGTPSVNSNYNYHFRPELKDNVMSLIFTLYYESKYEALTNLVFYYFTNSMTVSSIGNRFKEIQTSISKRLDSTTLKFLDPDLQALQEISLELSARHIDEDFMKLLEDTFTEKFSDYPKSFEDFINDAGTYLLVSVFTGELTRARNYMKARLYLYFRDHHRINGGFGYLLNFNKVDYEGAITYLFYDKLLPGIFDMDFIEDTLNEVLQHLPTPENLVSLSYIEKLEDRMEDRTVSPRKNYPANYESRVITKISKFFPVKYNIMDPELDDEDDIIPNLMYNLNLPLKETPYFLNLPTDISKLKFYHDKLHIPETQSLCLDIYLSTTSPYLTFSLHEKEEPTEVLALLLYDNLSKSFIRVLGADGLPVSIDTLETISKVFPVKLEMSKFIKAKL